MRSFRSSNVAGNVTVPHKRHALATMQSLQATEGGYLAFGRIAAIMPVVVDLPLEPVIPIVRPASSVARSPITARASSAAT